MDEVDLKLLALLRTSGRASYAELGRSIGLSAPAAHERVNKLEARGIITGYGANIDPRALGLGFTALVGVQVVDHAVDDALLETLRSMPQIEDCMFVAGDEAYSLKVRVPHMEQLEDILMQIIRIKGVTRTRTTIVLSTKWEGRVDGLIPHVSHSSAQDEL
ncbi:MAG: Lrp/AsnC family transcriptional regulator [Antricoccus sp.]